MQTFEFTLVVTGVDPSEGAFEDRFYEAGCSDALVSVVKGSIVLDFTREAKNFAHALSSAIEDVQKAGARVIGVEPDTYATITDIADRVGLTRQAVFNFVQGIRGPGGFPPPSRRVSSESPLWDWVTVARWFRGYESITNRREIVHARLIRELGLIIEMQDGAVSVSAKRALPSQTLSNVIYTNQRELEAD